MESATRFLDCYGGKSTGEEHTPEDRPKTWVGAVLSVIFKLLFLTLIILSLITLLAFERSAVDGDAIVFNSRGIANDPTGIPQFPTMDFPALAISAKHTMTFYESEHPTVQSIEVEDVTGFNTGFRSTERLVPAVQAGTVDGLRVELGTIDSRSNVSLPDSFFRKPVTIKDLQDMMAPQEFSEETLKILYFRFNVFDTTTEFVPHKASFYSLFDSEQLGRLKKCQLQVVFENQGYDELYPKEAHKRAETSRASDFTWAPRNFAGLQNGRPGLLWRPVNQIGEKKLNMLTQSVDMESAPLDFAAKGISGDTFNSWQFSLNYVNNFNHTFLEDTCVQSAARIRSGTQRPFVFFGTLLNVANNNTVHTYKVVERFTSIHYPVAENNTVLQAFCGELSRTDCLPFWTTISSVWGVERVQVTDISADLTSVVVLRANPISHERTLDPEPVVKRAWPVNIDGPLPPPPYIPADLDEKSNYKPYLWMCPWINYGENDGCHCSCSFGFADPDCKNPKADIIGCNSGEFCSMAGRCTNFNFTQSWQIAFGPACDQLYMAGTTELLGFSGTKQQYEEQSQGRCPSCPGDLINFEESRKDINGDVVCNYAPKASIIPRFVDRAYGGDLIVQEFAGEPSDVCYLYGTGEYHKPENLALLSEFIKSVVNKLVVHLDPLASGFPLVQFDYTDSVEKRKARMIELFGEVPTVVMRGGTESLYFDFVGSDPRDPLTHKQKIDLVPRVLDPTKILDTFSALFSQISTGAVFSTVTRQTKRVIVLMDRLMLPEEVFLLAPFALPIKRVIQASYSEFPQKGPYEVVMGDIKLKVSSAEPIYFEPTSFCFPAFILNLAEFPDVANPIGLISYLESDIVPGKQEFVNLTAQGLGIFYEFTAVVTATERWGEMQPEWFLSWPFMPVAVDTNDDLSFELVICANRPEVMSSPDITLQRVKFYCHKPFWKYHRKGAFLDIVTPFQIPRVYRATEVELVRKEKPYKPTERWRATDQEPWESPAAISTNVGMFVTPVAKNFSETSFCPSISTPSPFTPPRDYADWKAADGKEFTVTGCSGGAFDMSSCRTPDQLPKGVYQAYCLSLMPPTHTAEFTTVMPITNKWDFGDSDLNLDYSHRPEWLYDFQTVFTFAHRSDINEQEVKFTGSGWDSKLFDQNGVQQSFTGSLAYKGGNPRTVDPFPANVPYLTVNVTLNKMADAISLEDFRRDRPVMWPVLDDQVETMLADAGEELHIQWELDSVGGSTALSTLKLQPGWEYQLKAVLELVPEYENDLVSVYWYRRYKVQVLQTSASRFPLDRLVGQDMRVRYRFELARKTKQRMLQLNYTLIDFLLGIGAAWAYAEFGMLFLVFWQNVLRKKVYAQYDVGDNNGGDEAAKGDARADVELAAVETGLPQPLYGFRSPFTALMTFVERNELTQEEADFIEKLTIASDEVLWAAFDHYKLYGGEMRLLKRFKALIEVRDKKNERPLVTQATV